MGFLEVLGGLIGKGAKSAVTPQTDVLGEILGMTTAVPKGIYKGFTGEEMPGLISEAQAAVPPQEEQEKPTGEQMLGELTTSTPMPRQQEEQGGSYLGMLQGMMGQQQKPKSKWDNIFDTITKRSQQASGMLHAIGGDNTALDRVVKQQQTQEPSNMAELYLKQQQLEEQARHNRAIEGRGFADQEPSIEKLKRAIVPGMAKSLVGKDKPGWFTGDYTASEAIKEAMKGFGGGGLSEQDQQALQWAQANPTDPRAQKILAQFGG